MTAKEAPKESPKGAGSARIRAALDKLHGGLSKRYGDDIIKTVAELQKPPECFPTGILTIDQITGIGGLPRGQIIEIYGPPQGGKTTLTLHTIAMAQAAGFFCLFIDFEHTFDPVYAGRLGVSMDETKFALCRPADLEQGLSVANSYLKMAKDINLGIIAIDSIAAMPPRSEMESPKDGNKYEVTGMTIGGQSRGVSQAIKHMVHTLSEYGVTLIGINQIRNKITAIGSSQTTPGGEALKHYASMRIDMRAIRLIEKDGAVVPVAPIVALEEKAEAVKEEGGTTAVSFAQTAPAADPFKGEINKTGKTAVGSHVRIKIVKSKRSNPYQQAELDLLFGIGFDKVRDLYDLVTLRRLAHRSRKGGYVWQIAGPGSTTYEVAFRDVDTFRKAFISRPDIYKSAYDNLCRHPVMDPELRKVVEPVDIKEDSVD